MARREKLYTKQYIMDQMTDNEVDLSMNELTTVPVKELVRMNLLPCNIAINFYCRPLYLEVTGWTYLEIS